MHKCKEGVHQSASCLGHKTTLSWVNLHASRTVVMPVRTLRAQDMVRQYLPAILATIDQLPLDQVCTSIGLCPGAATQSPFKPSFSAAGRRHLRAHAGTHRGPHGTHVIRTTAQAAAEQLHGTWSAAAEKVRARYGAVGGGSNGGGENSLTCDFCNMAVQYVKVALHNNKTMEQIELVGVRV